MKAKTLILIFSDFLETRAWACALGSPNETQKHNETSCGEFSLDVVSVAQLFPMTSSAEAASGRHNIQNQPKSPGFGFGLVTSSTNWSWNNFSHRSGNVASLCFCLFSELGSPFFTRILSFVQ